MVVYFNNSPKDKSITKSLVSITCLVSVRYLSSFQKVLVVWLVYALVHGLELFLEYLSRRRILDFLHMVMISHAVYYYTVTNYMNPIALLRITWSAPFRSWFSTIFT